MGAVLREIADSEASVRELGGSSGSAVKHRVGAVDLWQGVGLCGKR